MHRSLWKSSTWPLPQTMKHSMSPLSHPSPLSYHMIVQTLQDYLWYRMPHAALQNRNGALQPVNFRADTDLKELEEAFREALFQASPSAPFLGAEKKGAMSLHATPASADSSGSTFISGPGKPHPPSCKGISRRDDILSTPHSAGSSIQRIPPSRSRSRHNSDLVLPSIPDANAGASIPPSPLSARSKTLPPEKARKAVVLPAAPTRARTLLASIAPPAPVMVTKPAPVDVALALQLDPAWMAQALLALVGWMGVLMMSRRTANVPKTRTVPTAGR
jgi:hypothetical protein